MKYIISILLASLLIACNDDADSPPASASGVTKATVGISVGSDGLTVEQRNVRDRLTMDNDPGSIKHLYIISAFSGDVLVYSTVRGKVTSSGKRLSPYSVIPQSTGPSLDYKGMRVQIDGTDHWTGEILQDDGTYGSSIPYLFWWDQQDRYHQHYVSGGQIIHVSDKPLSTKKPIINMELIGPSAASQDD